MTAAHKRAIFVRAEKRPSVVHISIPRADRREPLPNLRLHRWHHPLPDADGEAELVRRAKAGDRKAAEQLVKNYHRLIVAYAGKRRLNHSYRKGNKEFTNEAFDDLFGRGFLALWQAVLSYEPTLGPFSAYAKASIAGQISDESKAIIKRGLYGESRADRWLFSPQGNPGSNGGRIQAEG